MVGVGMAMSIYILFQKKRLDVRSPDGGVQCEGPCVSYSR